MKKHGFTLAEVLITLAILGVLAVLTIPNLSTEARREANAKHFGVAVSAVENALASGILIEGRRNIDDTTLLSNLCDTQNGLARYLVGTCRDNSTITMKNGAVLTFAGRNIQIDVDGANGPGEENNDVFNVQIRDDGIITSTNETTQALMENGFRISRNKKSNNESNNESNS